MTALHDPREVVPAPLSMPRYARTSDRLSNTTRYLCSAAFLVPGFADKVVRELIGETRRSVPPSHGYDLDPVIRQCFRVRRLRLAQHLITTLLYLIAAAMSLPVVFAWTVIGGLFRIARSATLRALLERFRLYQFRRWIFGVLAVGTAIALVAVISTIMQLSSLIQEEYGRSALPADMSGDARAFDGNWAALLTLGLIFVVAYLFRRFDHKVVTTEFAPGVAHRRHRLRDTLIEDRMALIASAQRGNVVVHHDNPFLGCGRIEQGWSFSMTLRPRTPAGDRPEQPVRIDPVALNHRLKSAIENMRAPWLAEGERVTGLSVRPYVVADGVRDEDDPVIDPETAMPYTLADDATVDAIVANPQGGLRQYLRVVVPVRGKSIRDRHDRMILDAQALGISVNAFVHVAVEGGMLYAEFLGTVLPPLRPECQLADTLRPAQAGSYAFRAALSTAVIDVIAGPVRLAKAIWRATALRWAMHRSVQQAREFRTHDYGARLSVRDLASADDLDSYLQKLDGIKYVKLVDRIVGETIIDFLVEGGVDPLEFRQAVNQITLNNSSLVQVGTISGGQNNFGGEGNVFTTQIGGSQGA